MKYHDFQDISLSGLGFGAMRLPVKDGGIDEETLQKMVDYAIEHGVNYFDTAFPYHEGRSEIALGKALKKYPRGSFYLADKYPGHQIFDTYYPAEIFEEQLKKCDVEYFDFYLLHNVYEGSIKTYQDPQWGIIDYFLEQKKAGRIRHLGFSSHANLQTLREFLDSYGEHMEFCQIQLNYLDWTLQHAKEKYELLTERGIPVWVMEPVRGGKLASLGEKHEKQLRGYRPEESTASWCFRWLMNLPNVKVVLSGMSDLSQMEDNVRTFEDGQPLSEEENALLLAIAEELKESVPCTACRYCCDGCPMGLDIPMLIGAYNDIKFSGDMTASMQLDALDENKRPAACIACGACAKICPQKINIPEVLADLAERYAKMPSWAELCRQRNEAAKRNRESN